MTEEITLEAVRGKTEIVQALEAPLKAEVEKLTQELAKTKEALTAATTRIEASDREAYIKELAGKFPDPEKALGVIQELCKDEKTKAAIAEKVMPLLLDAIKQNPPKPPEAPKPEDLNPILKLFPTPSATGAGSVLGLEALNSKVEDREDVTGLSVPA